MVRICHVWLDGSCFCDQSMQHESSVNTFNTLMRIRGVPLPAGEQDCPHLHLNGDPTAETDRCQNAQTPELIGIKRSSLLTLNYVERRRCFGILEMFLQNLNDIYWNMKL